MRELEERITVGDFRDDSNAEKLESRLENILPRLRRERAVAADDNNADTAARKMEDNLNLFTLLSAICFKAMCGFGKLAFIWATVVLLGGFATLVKQRDFWFVTVIAFIEAIGWFGGSNDQDQEFVFRTGEALNGVERRWDWERRIWRKHGVRVDVNSSVLCPESKWYGYLMFVAMTMAMLAAATALVALPSLRLSKQDYVDPEFQSHPDHSNIRRSLNIFYGLVLAQGSSFLCSLINGYVIEAMSREIISKYKLGFSSRAALARYSNNNFKLCIDGNVRAALNMDFLAYAMGLVRSDSIADQLVGVRAIDDILAEPRYRVLAPDSLLNSSETIDRLVRILAYEGDGQHLKGPAASILLSLAPTLLAGTVQRLLNFTSSLLQERIDGDLEYAWFGLSIIDKLMNNPHNHRFAMEEADNLLSKLIGLANSCLAHRRHSLQLQLPNLIRLATTPPNSSSPPPPEIAVPQTRPSKHDQIIIHQEEIQPEIILSMSLSLLHKLVAIGGEAGNQLKRGLAELLTISNDSDNWKTMIKEHGDRVMMMKIIACCALDDTAREQVGNTPEIIRTLVNAASCFLLLSATSDSEQQQPDAAAAATAAEALLLLTMDRKSSSVIAVLGEIDDQQMQQLVNSLLSESGSMQRRGMAAKLLRNLRAYMGTEYTDRPHLMKVIDNALPEVLKAIVAGVNKMEEKEEIEKNAENIQDASNTSGDRDGLKTEEGKVLESFVGLAVQICASKKLSDPPKENNNDSTHPIIDGILVEKLTKILGTYRSPTTDIPGIRRVTIELMIWMMKNDGRNIGLFQSTSRAADELKNVAKTAGKLENFSLFYNGVGVGKHGKPVSSVARAALALIQGNPSAS